MQRLSVVLVKPEKLCDNKKEEEEVGAFIHTILSHTLSRLGSLAEGGYVDIFPLGNTMLRRNCSVSAAMRGHIPYFEPTKFDRNAMS